MENEFKTFVDHWHEIALIWAKISLATAVVIFLFYTIKQALTSNLVNKYEYIEKNEVKYYWLTALALVVSFVFFLNSLIVKEHATDTVFVLSLKISVSLGAGFAIAYFINTYLHIYYPFRLEKKLHRIRFTPRISPISKKEMKLLTEKEEDVHLTQDMIDHENLKAYEYDVWVDEESDYKIIETYAGNLHLEVCEKCNYRTAHQYLEIMEKEPTATEEGSLKRLYRCSYCEHEQEVVSKIAKL
jgi:hypothetical protein